MSLLTFWKTAQEAVLKLSIEQIVNNAGDGNLKDASECSLQLREYFSKAPQEHLFKYAHHCLGSPFTNSGLVLQDLVNEFGRRLDFDVEDGLYRGKPTAIGFDGIWRANSQPALIIEVKTTDYVSIDLDRNNGYKNKLRDKEQVSSDASTLIVVGREDTGALEAQIRGSRFAWEMRVISVDRLIKLVQIKHQSDEPSTVLQIRQLLQPFEYTKIDRIIDVIFTATTNVEVQEKAESSALSPSAPTDLVITPRLIDEETLDQKRSRAVRSLAAKLGIDLIQAGKTLFWSADKSVRICCAVSKRYESASSKYWYAYHPTWDSFLSEGRSGYFLLACMDQDKAIAIPYQTFITFKDDLNTTTSGERHYWHVVLTQDANTDFELNLSKIGRREPLKKYEFNLLTTQPM